MGVAFDERTGTFVDDGSQPVQGAVVATPQPVQGSVVSQPVQGQVVATQPQGQVVATQPVVVPQQVVQGTAQPVYVQQPQQMYVQPGMVATQTHVVAMQPVRQVVIQEQYCGPNTCCIAIILVFLFWPAALCLPCCPCDRRDRIISG